MKDRLESLMLDYELAYNSFVFDRGRLADFLIAHGVTFADVPDTNVGRWIPVSERLPEQTKKCLVWCEVEHHADVIKFMDMVYYNTSEKVWVMDGCKVNGVTHWMPLPEPPRS